MKLLVISDVHGKRHRIGEVLDKHPAHDGVLFLGDGLRDFEDHESRIINFTAVSGNCDMLSYLALRPGGVPEELLLELGGFRVLMMHGHAHGVKSGTERAVAYAHSRGADILLYGHTHTPEEKYYPEGTAIGGIATERPMYVFNPGSLGEPRGGKPSYGVIELRGGNVLFSHGSL